MRNEDYINAHIKELGLDRPFFPITVDNQIDLGAPCRAGCPECAYGDRSVARPVDEILLEMGKVAPEYTRMEFYGGDAFLREDLFTILDRLPRWKKIILWSTPGQAQTSGSFVERLRGYPIEAIKVRLSMAVGDTTARFLSALRDISLLCYRGLPVHLYVPMDLEARYRAVLSRNVGQVGIERLYTFTTDLEQPLVNSVGCFGRGMGRARILWVEKRNDPSWAGLYAWSG